MKKALLTKLMLLLCALIAGSSSVWAQVTSLAPADEGSYVIAAYVNSKYYALPNGAVGGGTIAGTEITLNAVNKVNTTDAAGLTWTLKKGTDANANFYHIEYTSGSDTYGLYKNGTGGTNYNFAVNKTSRTYWSFTANGTGYTVAAEDRGTTNNVNIQCNNGTFRCYSTATPIILLEVGDAPSGTTAAPTISGDTPFLTNTTVTINNAASADGAAIYYTLNGDDPTTTTSATCFAYSAPFSIDATTTVKAIAKKASDTNASSVVSKTFTKITPLANISALTANTETGTYYVTLDNAVVTFVSGNNAYIQDASGAVLYYKSGHGLTAGQRLSGTATVAFQLYKANPQITDLSGITPTGGDAPVPTPVAASAWTYTFNNVLSQYFQITGATITSSDSKYYVSLNGENVQIYKSGGGMSISDLTKKYTITGFPTLNNSTKEILVYANPAEEVSTDPAIAATPTSLTGFFYMPGNGPSAAKTISVAGSNLTADISLSASTNYEISTTENSGYTNSLTLTQTAGAVAATTVYVRLKAGLTSGDYNGTITLTSTGATDVTVNLSGSVITTASLPFSWTGTSTAGKAELDAVTGVEVNLGTDFAASNAPYRLKFDGTTKYVIIYTDGKPETVAFTAKIFNATTTEVGSKIKVQGSSDGIDFTDIEEFTIKGADNETFQFTTTKPFDDSHRAVKLIMSNKDQNVAVGTIAIISGTSISLVPGNTYTTLTSAFPLDFTGLANLEAYIVTDNDASDGYVTLTQVNKVPANTGLVLKAASTGSPIDVPVLTDAADDVTGNLMAGSATATTAIVANAGYILSDGAFHPASAGTLPAGKAYLNIPASAPVLLLNFDGDVTGVNEVRGKMENVRGGMYDLQGRKVAQPSKGLYIVNGKKYVVK